MKCPNCKVNIPNNATKCPVCGGAINTGGPYTPPNPPTPPKSSGPTVEPSE